MSGRCKACDAILEEWEMREIDPLTGTYTELCNYCLGDENDDLDIIDLELESLSVDDLL